MSGQNPALESWAATAARRSGIEIPADELQGVADHLGLLLHLAAAVEEALPEQAPVYRP